MEPPPFGDGNNTEQHERRRRHAASMEPPPFGDGNFDHGQENAEVGSASMEPPPFGDGNLLDTAGPPSQMYASMEPPPFGDGNQHITLVADGAACSFNGATAFRRWKLYQPLQTFAGYRRFNGATAFRRWKRHIDAPWPLVAIKLQWSHRLSAMETAHCRGDEAGDVLASMEPPPFGDGNSRLAPEAWSRACCFNGATAFRRWKPLFVACLRRKSRGKSVFPQ